MPLEDQTLVDLVNEVFRLFRSLKSLSHEPSAEGPRLAHIGIIGLLAQSGECRASALAELIGVGPSALSRQLADLADQGLVLRRPDPEDGRATLIKVSAEGSQVLAGVMAQRAERMRQRLSDWNQAEAQDALAAVARLADAFQSSYSLPHGPLPHGALPHGAPQAGRAEPDESAKPTKPDQDSSALR